MCNKIVYDEPFKLKFCRDTCDMTQEMCNKAADDFLPALKFVLDWFVISKMIKKVLTVLYADENIFCFNKDSSDAVFSCNQMSTLTIDLNNNNLDGTNYDEDDLETIIHVRLLAWHIKFE